ncbi:MAG: DUF4442 domain-containing protein [Saprospiraceae bacterium]|nr:DUF4442 domain-containing protein [Saprospiraceae bacterium]MBK8850367.1 DUF4442 domain-containing protein [Saprospiraceae bacterium]MBL0083436.1 DUF4442 domain-containing protein [Saprospiraceae bacterium]
MTSTPEAYRKAILHPIKYRFYMLWRLPSLIFWGIRVKSIDHLSATVVMKHGWTNQNPFGSVYFSALNGAAELSTGILVQAALQGRPPFSMLVVESRAQFHKKAKGKLLFTCTQGEEVNATLQQLDQNGGNTTLWLHSSASNEAGETVGEFSFLWALKKK